MPLYEYSCEKCQETCELLVFEGDDVECPSCGSTKLHKLLSLPGMGQVKESGFPSACGDPSLPPCGAAGCRRMGKA